VALGVVLLLLAILILSGVYNDPCDDDGVAVHSPACDARFGRSAVSDVTTLEPREVEIPSTTMRVVPPADLWREAVDQRSVSSELYRWDQ